MTIECDENKAKVVATLAIYSGYMLYTKCVGLVESFWQDFSGSVTIGMHCTEIPCTLPGSARQACNLAPLGAIPVAASWIHTFMKVGSTTKSYKDEKHGCGAVQTAAGANPRRETADSGSQIFRSKANTGTPLHTRTDSEVKKHDCRLIQQ